MVGRHHLHLKHDAALPVGGNGEKVVRGPRNSGAAVDQSRSTVASCKDVVRESPHGRFSSSGPGRDGKNLCANRIVRTFLGSKIGSMALEYLNYMESQMPELKTKPTDQSVEKFLNTISDEKTRQDCFAILELMKQITKMPPKMWGTSIIGFGSYHYKYESGHEGDCFVTGFSPRKQNLTLYIMAGFSQYDELMKKLGKHKTGKSCLYIKRLDDIHLPTLKKLIQESVKFVSKSTS